MYRILITYSTDSTDRIERTTNLIEFCNEETGWKSIALEFCKRSEAREALVAIKEHYQFFNDYHGPYKDYCHNRANKNKKPLEVPKRSWFVDKKLSTGEQNWHEAEDNIMLGGYRINCFWNGYFESIHSAEIVMDRNLDKIEF